MKNIYILSIFLFIFSAVHSQDIRCGTYEEQQMLRSRPQHKEQLQEMQGKSEGWSADSSKRIDATITIPVVVHVVYHGTPQNIPDVQIKSQIDVLNEDYSALNADLSLVPTAFQSKVGNAAIQFCLATRKPNGDPTTGIERRYTDTIAFRIGDNYVKHTSQGGLDAWDRNKYLNIWVCNMNIYLGFTQPPGTGLAANDGTVIKYYAFGRVGTLSAPYNKGRTATHEIAHWLGLNHIWGDDGGSCSGSDGISDTPNQATYTAGCPTFPVTDACSPVSPGIMFMDFMDYTEDACMNMFTTGQVNFMRNILSTTRSTILSSNGCASTTGLKESDAERFLHVYPNPATDKVNIEVYTTARIMNLAIYNVIGEKILSMQATGENKTIVINTSELKEGLYILAVATQQGNMFSRFEIRR
jgi:hypothetical protein